jgi:hypothetical protein
LGSSLKNLVLWEWVAGFYVCKLKKISNGKKAGASEAVEEEEEPQEGVGADEGDAGPSGANEEGAPGGKGRAPGAGKRKADKEAPAEGDSSFFWLISRSKIAFLRGNL